MKHICLLLCIPIAVASSASAATAVATGDDFACGISTYGSDGALYCWGDDDQGQLGTGIIGNPAGKSGYDQPQTVADLPTGGAVTAVSLSNGDAEHAFGCAITNGSDGDLYCWGDDTYGELGDRGGANTGTPKAVYGLSDSFGTTWQISVGYRHACALATFEGASHIYCWGYGLDGEVVPGSKENYDQPEPVTDDNDPTSRVIGVYALQHDSCDERADGTIYCWGTDVFGAYHSAPYEPGGYDVTSLSESQGGMCATNIEGQIWCLGSNWEHQLGIIDDCYYENPPRDSWHLDQYCDTPALAYEDMVWTDWQQPTTASEGDVIQVAMGGNHACITTGTTYYCTGDNAYGEFGAGTQGNPVMTYGESDGWLESIAAGQNFMCGIGTDSNIYCWGDGSEGQVGNTSYVTETVPTRVTGIWE